MEMFIYNVCKIGAGSMANNLQLLGSEEWSNRNIIARNLGRVRMASKELHLKNIILWTVPMPIASEYLFNIKSMEIIF